MPGVALVPNSVLGVPDLRRTGRQRQILGVHRIDDVERRQSARQQLVRIDIDHDLAVFAAGRCGQGHAWNGSQLLTDPVDAEVVELLLIETVRLEAELEHRHARGIELHDDRRLDARRHQGADGVGRRNDLRDRKIEIDVRLKVDLLNRQPVEGLRLDVLDTADVGADRILAVGTDALLHLRRREAGVAPDDRNDGDPNLREDICRHRPDRDAAEKQDQRRKHIECVRKPEREANNSHGGLPGASYAGSSNR
ncbi:hypothetical protein ACVWWP_005036 [Bradyrhizobium sp. LM3.6]